LGYCPHGATHSVGLAWTGQWRNVGYACRSLQWGNLMGKPYTGNPSVRFDAGTEAQAEPPPTLFTRE